MLTAIEIASLSFPAILLFIDFARGRGRHEQPINGPARRALRAAQPSEPVSPRGPVWG